MSSNEVTPDTSKSPIQVDTNELRNDEEEGYKSHGASLEKITTMSTYAGADEKLSSSFHQGMDETREEEKDAWKKLFWQYIKDFYVQNEFLVLVISAILLAKAYPPLGAEYLQPQITATWLAVCIIFLMSGLGLKTEEFSKALQKVRFNMFVQGFNFGVVSGVTYLASLILKTSHVISEDLADGMVICSALPMAINVVIVLTKSAGGDEGLAIVNSAASNLLGVFLSPVLIVGYLGVTGDIALAEVFYKLTLKVLVPVGLGQIIQKTQPQMVAFFKKHKPMFKKVQELCLVFIVYTVFCETFNDDEAANSSIGDVFKMIGFLFLLLVSLQLLAWVTMGFFWPDQPEMRVVGLFGCTHKTVAMGVPLIGAMYESSSSVGLYTLPLLVWHPMQLVLGTLIVPYLAKYVEQEKIRLGRAGPQAKVDNSKNATSKMGDVETPPKEPQENQGAKSHDSVLAKLPLTIQQVVENEPESQVTAV